MWAGEERTPWAAHPRMTRAQVKQYIANMKKAQDLAKKKLELAKKSWELDQEDTKLAEIEELLEDDNLFT